MADMPFISIIIPTYNHGHFVQKAVSSLLRQSYLLDRYEIIVVDDGSTDDTGIRIADLQKISSRNIKYFFQKNKGPAAARNLGIKNSKGTVIAFMDADCVAANDWLAQIIQGYISDMIAGIGGRTEALPTASLVSRYCAYIAMNEKPPVDKNGIRYLITGNASFRKDVLMKAGGFDERYVTPGGEDPDICYRIKNLGYSFGYNRMAVVYNQHKDNLSSLLNTFYCYGKGSAYLMLRSASSWDLVSVKKMEWSLNFLKTIFRLVAIVTESLKCIIRFFKIIFKTAFYYGDGLSIRHSICYAFFDYARDFVFKQGFLVGYVQGKFKGFKKSGVDKDYINAHH